MRFGAQDPVGHADRLFKRMPQQEGICLPGDRRFRARQETAAAGIESPRSLYDTIRGLQAG